MHGPKPCLLPDQFYRTACTGQPFVLCRVTGVFLHVLLPGKIALENVESFL